MVGAILVALAMLCAPPAALAAPKLWKVSDGASTVYLYGSVHALKPTMDWDTPEVDAALAQSHELWLEIVDVDNPSAAQPLVQALGLDPAHPLRDQLGEKDRVRLTEALKTLGAPEAAVDVMRPWLAATVLEALPLQKAGYDPASGVDVLMKQAAVKRGVPVKGLETMEQQLHDLADLPPAQQLDLLRSTLDEFPDTLANVDRIVAAWEQGDEALLARLTRQDMPDSLYQRLFVDRNKAFAGAIAQQLKSPGVIMVVVGAGHLAGPDSVQAQLRKQGFTVTPP
jgi:uncharacterized protein YbaP (TraB family)